MGFRCPLPRPSRRLGHPHGVAFGSHLRETQQASPNHVQIWQRECHQKSIRALFESFVARLRKVKKTFDDQEPNFNISANTRLFIVPCSLLLEDRSHPKVATIRLTLCRKGERTDDRVLIQTGRVSQRLALLDVSEKRQAIRVVNNGSRRERGMNYLRSDTDPKVEVPKRF